MHKTWLGLAMVAATAGAWAQSSGGPSIYTCVDGKGRRLTSDRPIPECIDREQKELSSSGTVRRTVGPSLTAPERAAQEERERKAEEERQRAAEEKRRERALLQRYPNQAAHDSERGKALAAVQEVINAANKRTADLQEQRRKLMVETDFYAKEPSKMPAKLKQQLEESQKLIEGQARFLANQDEEKRRVNARFDEELRQLKVLWAKLASPQATLVPAAPAASAAASARR